MGKLVAGVTHEVNTPIGVVVSSVDVINRLIHKMTVDIEATSDLDTTADREQLMKSLESISKSAETTIEAAKRIDKFISSLKNFARIDEATFQLADIHEGINSTLDLIEYELGDRIRVERQFGKIPHIPCNPSELNQVFMLVLRNAIESIDDEGVITIRTEVKDNRILVIITDTGRGIEKEN